MKRIICLMIVMVLCSSLVFADDFKIEKEGNKYKITSFAMVEEANTDKLVNVKAGVITTTKGNLERFLEEINQNIVKTQSDLVKIQAAKDNVQSRIDTITGIELNDEAK